MRATHTCNMQWFFAVIIMSTTLVAQDASTGGYPSVAQSAEQDITAASNPEERQSTPISESQAALPHNYGEVPLAFEPNQGQAAPGVRFVSRAKGLSVLLE